MVSAVKAEAPAANLFGVLRTRLGVVPFAHGRRVATGIRNLGDD